MKIEFAITKPILYLHLDIYPATWEYSRGLSVHAGPWPVRRHGSTKALYCLLNLMTVAHDDVKGGDIDLTFNRQIKIIYGKKA